MVREQPRREDRAQPSLQEVEIRVEGQVDEPAYRREGSQYDEGERHHPGRVVRMQPVFRLRLGLDPTLLAPEHEQVGAPHVVGVGRR